MSKKKAKPHYLVLEDGVPCSKQPQAGLFGLDLCPASGVLVQYPQNPQWFAGELSAMQAISKTECLAKRLRESVISDFDKIQPFLNRGTFTVQKVAPES